MISKQHPQDCIGYKRRGYYFARFSRDVLVFADVPEKLMQNPRFTSLTKPLEQKDEKRS